MEETYEYIVVGSGAGGGPLAANLALAGHTVLVLEAGGCPEDEGCAEAYNCQVPAFHPNASEEPGMSWRFFVRHYADEEQQKKDWKYRSTEGGVFYPRAGTLGGCTAHNAMILVYPHNSDWDRIAELTGDKSWRARAMRRYYVRLEECRYRGILRFLFRLLRWNPSWHGFGGWLASETAAIKLLLDDRGLLWLVRWSVLKNLFTFRSGTGLLQDLWQAVKQVVFSVITWFDPNSWWSVVRRSEGFRMTPLARNAGHRAGSRERLLAVKNDPKLGDNLTIRLGALATRVLFDDDQRAVGVEYLEGAHLYRADPQPGENGTLRQARASREVILAGGAFNTPQLLQLSGVGPPDLLRRHGIPVRVELPGVGENLQDRYEITVVLRMDKPFSSFKDATLKPPAAGEAHDPQFTQWLAGGKGVYTTNGAALSFIKRSRPELPDPDLFIFGLVTDFRGYYPGYSKRIQEARRYFSWAVLKGGTHYRGKVEIGSADPRDVPSIDFRYFQGEGCKEDLDAMVHAVEFIFGITKGYGRRIDAEELPGKQKHNRKDLEEYVRNEAWGHHASCTCKIGVDGDPMAVLDGDFRVRGTKGLRVVDASVFPHIPGLFIVSAVYMIAEKASEVILRDARSAPQADSTG